MDVHDLHDDADRSGEDSEGSSDGRRLRRERNRQAVVEALLSHYREGNLAPSTEEIAGRAGISPRSLHRYFDDLDDLAQTAIDHAQAALGPLVMVDASPDQPFEHRVEALVAQRSELYEAVESVALVTRLRAPFHLVVAENLTRTRARLRRQVAALFAVELAGMDPELTARRLALADIATSFETYRLLRDDQRLSIAQTRMALAESLTLILDGDPT